MTYDPAARFVTALTCGTPEEITRLADCHNALTMAIGDVRCSGEDIEGDCAVQLLAIHYGRIAEQSIDNKAAPISIYEHMLRRACAAQLKACREKPLLALLAARDIGYNRQAKQLFHSQGRQALTRLAEALDLPPSYRLTTHQGSEYDAGGITLHTETLFLGLTTNYARRGTEFQYRRARSLFDSQGGPNFYAPVTALLEPERMARQIVADLKLSLSPPAQARRVG